MATVYLLLRVGSKEKISEQFREKYIEFSCPENWINLARKNKDNKAGDELECVFARLPKGDNTIYQLIPGYPWMPEINGTSRTEIDDNSCYYSCELTKQMPTICFYSRDIKTEMQDSPDGTLEFDLDEYCQELGYNPKEASYLLIHTPEPFFKELEQQLPLAIEEHKKIGYIFPHESTKNLTRWLFGGYTKVFKLKDDEFFMDLKDETPEILRKIQREGMPDFEKLHEFRLFTYKYFFWQLDYKDGQYDYRKNTLRVNLPNLYKYGNKFDGAEYSGVRISNFNPKTNQYTITGIFRKK